MYHYSLMSIIKNKVIAENKQLIASQELLNSTHEMNTVLRTQIVTADSMKNELNTERDKYLCRYMECKNCLKHNEFILKCKDKEIQKLKWQKSGLGNSGLGKSPKTDASIGYTYNTLPSTSPKSTKKRTSSDFDSISSSLTMQSPHNLMSHEEQNKLKLINLSGKSGNQQKKSRSQSQSSRLKVTTSKSQSSNSSEKTLAL